MTDTAVTTDQRTHPVPDMASLRLDVLLADYKRIAADILAHKETQKVILNFIILLVAAEIAMVQQSSVEAHIYANPSLLLLIPIPFAFLSLYHSATTMRVHELASYVDSELRVRIEEIVGPNALRKQSYWPTKSILQFGRARQDGKLTYSAIFGIKLLPQAVPLVAFGQISGFGAAWWEYFALALVCGLALISVVGQHD